MAQLSSKIRKYLDREVDFTKDVILQDDSDGKGAYIKEWNVEEAQPTEEQLNSFESQANDLETLNQVYANRQAEYPSVQDLVVALYDTEDKIAIDIKRAEIKLKYPKP
jgi:hypothetical protein